MRLLHLLNEVRDVGNGIANAVVDLACAQQGLGHDVIVASAGGDYVSLLEAHGIKHLHVDQRRKPAQLVRASAQLRRTIVHRSVDIVHAHMNFGSLLARVSMAGTRCKLVCTVHTPFKASSTLMALGHRVVAPSNAVADLLQRRSVFRSQVRVVHNGTIGGPRIPVPAEVTPVSLLHPAVLTVAGLYDRKGIGLLIDAFVAIGARFPDAHLYIVGEGPQRRVFEEQARGSGAADRIHFEGFQGCPQAYMLETDLFVLASFTEASPLVIIEAREAGCAIVASTAQGIPEACDLGRAAYLFPVGDRDSLASAMTALLGDRDELRAWREAARRNLEYYTVDRVAAQIDRVYAEVLQG